MKMFISWSGNETKLLAEALQAWVQKVLLNKVEPFVSSRDIAKGDRGLNVIAEGLESMDYGVVILTKANQGAEWINFEAGALAKSLGKGRVSPLLVDLTQADVSGPLSQFQMTTLTDKEDVWKLVRDINSALEDELPEASIRIIFDSAWDELEAAVSKARKGGGPTKTTRPSDDILEEILYRVRRIERTPRNSRDQSDSPDDSEALLAEQISMNFGGRARIRFRSTPDGDQHAMVIVENDADTEGQVDVRGLQSVADSYDIILQIEMDDRPSQLIRPRRQRDIHPSRKKSVNTASPTIPG